MAAYVSAIKMKETYKKTNLQKHAKSLGLEPPKETVRRRSTEDDLEHHHDPAAAYVSNRTYSGRHILLHRLQLRCSVLLLCGFPIRILLGLWFRPGADWFVFVSCSLSDALYGIIFHDHDILPPTQSKSS